MCARTMQRCRRSGKRCDGPDSDSLKCKMGRPHGVFVDVDGSVFVGDS